MNRLAYNILLIKMNMMRRLLRLAPLMVLPVFKYDKVWMNTPTQETINTATFDEIPVVDVKIPINVTITGQEHNKNEPETQKTSQQQTKQSERKADPSPSSNPSSEIKQQQSNLDKAQMAIPNEQTTLPVPDILQSQIDNIEIKQNEAIVNSSCPIHILTYLQQTNHKIYHTDDPTCKLKLKNRKGDLFTLNEEQIAAQKKDEMQLIANFINPPIELATIDEAKQIMKMQQKDSYLVCSYLPKQEDYDKLIQSWTRSVFDSFTATRKAKLNELQQTFTSLAYNSSSNRNTYLIARNKEVADYLRINTFNIGIPYIMNKTTRQSGNQSNNEWEGTRYYVSNLAKQWKGVINRQVINHLTHFYINKVESQQQAYNKIRQMQMSGDQRKLLLVYTNQNRQEFHTQLDDILQKVARTQKEKVVVLKTQNQQILRNLFKIEPDNFTTIRLLNLNQQQTPLFGSTNINSHYYSRCKLKGPFRYENLCNMVNAKQWQQYYESKRKLTHIKTVGPQELRKLDNTLVLLQKQGCQGCKYVEESLDELKKVIKALMSNSKFKKNLIYRFKIEDPNSLSSLKIRRYSIFNESLQFTPPTTTPKLYMFSEGKFLDLKVDESLGKLKQVKSDHEAVNIDDMVLSDVINKIRRSQDETFSEF